MKILLLLCVLCITGCTSMSAIKTEIQRVEIPIAVLCKTDVPTAPELNFDKLTKSSDIFEKTKSLLADRKLHLAYEEELLAALLSCK